MRKFADGGFTPAQEEWLNGADRTDPIILARMRAAIPDEKVSVKDVIEDTKSGEPKSVEKTVVKTKVTPASKITGDDTYDPSIKMRDKASKLQDLKDVVLGKGSTSLRSFKSSGGSDKAKSSTEDLSSLRFKMPSDPLARYDNKNWSMKSGGKVSSASKRADGIAQKGKTRGKIC